MKVGTKIEEVGKWHSKFPDSWSLERIRYFRSYYFSDHIDVRTDDIFSELIKEAGRLCESYASGVLRLIEEVRSNAEQSVTNFGGSNREHPVGIMTWIGFRKYGIKHFTLHSDTDPDGMDDEWRENNEYFSKFTLSVNFTKDGEVKMELVRHD